MKRILLMVGFVAVIGVPVYAQDSVSGRAKAQIVKEEDEARVSEAKSLLKELAVLESRIGDIQERLAELDKGAKGKTVLTDNTSYSWSGHLPPITTTGSIVCSSCASYYSK